MTKRLNSWLDEWARDMVSQANNSGFSGINVVEKILRDPGISTKGGSHKILWWPKTRRIAKLSRAMHQIDPISQICLIVDAKAIMREDGNVFTKRDLVKNSSLTTREVREKLRQSKRRLSALLRIHS